MNPRSSFRQATCLRLALLALLLFAMQPLLHAHPSAQVPPEHRDGLHGPGPDFARATLGQGDSAPDPVVVAEGTRLDDSPAAVGEIVTRRPDGDASRPSPAIPPGLAPRPPPRTGAPRGPPR